MTAGARSCRLSATTAPHRAPEKRGQAGSSLNRAAVHFVAQRVEPIVGVQVGTVAKAMCSRTGVAAADEPADTRLTFEVFSSRVVLHR
ncbi:hypothetical protein MAAFP003_1687 [Mycobacterium ahvazicum]|uniref:Uncharacterized protein n=1 Tax=Mycobacterium ahvazicum TaxID=1964395 RepID=A0A2K4Y8E0_9MYCO|nr:hypothetical protein MAAFP003_1687 [Mycobacterium ahvazicum]